MVIFLLVCLSVHVDIIKLIQPVIALLLFIVFCIVRYVHVRHFVPSFLFVYSIVKYYEHS